MITPPKTYEEYQKEIEKRLNWFEKLITGVTSSDERVDATNILLMELIRSLAELKTSFGFPPIRENPSRVVALQKLVATAGTAEQLPDVLIPYDHEVIIKALPTNTDTVYLGSSKPDAEDHTKGFPLEAGEGVEYKIRNLSVLWLDVDVAGEGVAWTVEQEAREE